MAELPDEARVAERVAEADDLVIERRRPDVRVVDKAGHQVLGEGIERVGSMSGAHSGHPLAAEIGPDGLSVPAQVPGDRRNRPASFFQCMCFHVFPMCEHAERVLPSSWLLGRCQLRRGAQPRGWMVSSPLRLGNSDDQGWGISVIVGSWTVCP